MQHGNKLCLLQKSGTVIWFVPGFLFHSVLGAGVWWWLFGCWLFWCGPPTSAEHSERARSYSFSVSWCLDQPHVGRVVFLCPQPSRKAALGKAGTCCCCMPQSCSQPRAGAPGRDGSQMWLPELSPPPSADHHPSQGSLRLDAEQAAYTVVLGVNSFPGKGGPSGEDSGWWWTASIATTINF